MFASQLTGEESARRPFSGLASYNVIHQVNADGNYLRQIKLWRNLKRWSITEPCRSQSSQSEIAKRSTTTAINHELHQQSEKPITRIDERLTHFVLIV
jgi:RNase H-fold protein (predicted Holliday junction resolvase)